ncbi:MAG: tetratricopeptide repeat protein [Gammaproteobacteria bacterium]|nr:tetratricopeptide repeat protein [Gammaproteobacteria bacterium]
MKIFRWLLSHTLLILVIIVVIYGYMFWGNLLGQNTPAGKLVAALSSQFNEVDEFVTATKEKQAILNQDKTSEPAKTVAVTTDQLSSGLEDSEPEKVIADDSVEPTIAIKQQPVTISYRHNQVQITQNSAGIVEKKTKEIAITDIDNVAHESIAALANLSPADETVPEQEQGVDAFVLDTIEQQTAEEEPEQTLAVATLTVKQPGSEQSATVSNTPIQLQRNSVVVIEKENEAKPVEIKQAEGSNKVSEVGEVSEEKFVTEEVAKQLDNVDDSGRAIDNAQRAASLKYNWILARQSFYQRNYALSEQSYQKVIEATQNNFDAYGELGNVYFNQGKNKQAASAYFEAAAIFLKNGQINRARSMMGVLQRLDISKARELQMLIDSTAS